MRLAILVTALFVGLVVADIPFTSVNQLEGTWAFLGGSPTPSCVPFTYNGANIQLYVPGIEGPCQFVPDFSSSRHAIACSKDPNFAGPYPALLNIGNRNNRTLTILRAGQPDYSTRFVQCPRDATFFTGQWRTPVVDVSFIVPPSNATHNQTVIDVVFTRMPAPLSTSASIPSSAYMIVVIEVTRNVTTIEQGSPTGWFIAKDVVHGVEVFQSDADGLGGSNGVRILGTDTKKLLNIRLFAYKWNDDGSLLITYTRSAAQMGNVTFERGHDDQVYEDHYPVVTVSPGRYAYGPSRLMNSMGETTIDNQVPSFEVFTSSPSVLSYVWNHPYYGEFVCTERLESTPPPPNSTDSSKPETILSVLTHKGHVECTAPNPPSLGLPYSETRKFLRLRSHMDDSIEYVVSAPLSTADAIADPAAFAPAGSTASRRFYMFPRSPGYALSGRWTIEGYTTPQPFIPQTSSPSRYGAQNAHVSQCTLTAPVNTNTITYRMPLTDYSLTFDTVSQGTLTQKGPGGTKYNKFIVNATRGVLTFTVNNCAIDSTDCDVGFPSPSVTNTSTMTWTRCDAFYLDHLLGDFRDTVGLGVTFDASAARGRRTSRQPYIVGNSDRHTGYIIDNIDLAQRLIRRAVYSQLDPLPDPLLQQDLMFETTSIGDLVTVSSVVYAGKNHTSFDTRFVAEGTDGTIQRITPRYDSNEVFSGGDWYHTEALACVPHDRYLEHSIGYNQEHRDGVDPDDCQLHFADKVPFGVRQCRSHKGAFSTSYFFAMPQRPHRATVVRFFNLPTATPIQVQPTLLSDINDLPIEVDSRMLSFIQGSVSAAARLPPAFAMWSPCESSPFSRIPDNLVSGHFYTSSLSKRYPALSLEKLHFEWRSILTFTPPDPSNATCTEWVGDEVSLDGREASFSPLRHTISGSPDTIQRVVFSYDSSAAWIETEAATVVAYATQTPEGFVVLRELERGPTQLTEADMSFINEANLRSLTSRHDSTQEDSEQLYKATPASLSVGAPTASLNTFAIRLVLQARLALIQPGIVAAAAAPGNNQYILVRCPPQSLSEHLFGERHISYRISGEPGFTYSLGKVSASPNDETYNRLTVDKDGLTINIALESSHRATVLDYHNTETTAGSWWVDGAGHLHVAYAKTPHTPEVLGGDGLNSTYIRIAPKGPTGSLDSFYGGFWAPLHAKSNNECVLYVEDKPAPYFIARKHYDSNRHENISDTFFFNNYHGKRVMRGRHEYEPLAWHNIFFTPAAPGTGAFDLVVHKDSDDYDSGYAVGASRFRRDNGGRTEVIRLIPCVASVRYRTVVSFPANRLNIVARVVDAIAAATKVDPSQIYNRNLTIHTPPSNDNEDVKATFIASIRVSGDGNEQVLTLVNQVLSIKGSLPQGITVDGTESAAAIDDSLLPPQPHPDDNGNDPSNTPIIVIAVLASLAAAAIIFLVLRKCCRDRCQGQAHTLLGDDGARYTTFNDQGNRADGYSSAQPAVNAYRQGSLHADAQYMNEYGGYNNRQGGR